LKNLIIVESPAKARTIEKFLGKDFEAAACGGHIRDLPPRSLGVNIEKNFEPYYVIIKGKEGIIKLLRSKAEKAESVYLAPDPDREGEAIAWHLKTVLNLDGKVKRIEFNEITKEAVVASLKHPRDIDQARVDAQQARRILDRLVGYKLSPLLWKKVRKGLSAGRVQSVAVRLICEREEEIRKFKPQEYWDIRALLSKGKEEFWAKLVGKKGEAYGVSPKEKGKVISSEAEAKKITEEISSASFVVSEVRQKEQKRYPAAPFITSTLQQEAARRLGFSAKKTMTLAQKLYEGVEVKGEGRVGLITYMRTDSVRVATEAVAEVRKFIAENFGTNYLPPNPVIYKKKKQAQDAHEAIRPTSVMRHPEKIKESLKGDEFQLYELIWKRFVACQMDAAIFDQISVDIKAKDYLFRATGATLKFDGFLRIYEESTEEEPGETIGTLPKLGEKEKLLLKKLIPQSHFTEPPPRYTEASLVKELEQKGIGRPSTYAPIISTIQERGYVIKEGKSLRPTEIGQITNDLLVKHFPKILDVKFTAHMEDDLDKILTKKINWITVLKEFYIPFEASLKEAEEKMEKVKKEIMTEEVCPECGSKLVIRQGRYGDFIACSNYPKCKFTKNLPAEGDQESTLKETCEKCGRPMTIKHGRYGDFLACTGYPECKNIKPILKKIGVKCPKCGAELVEKRTKKGKLFYSCSNYPQCDFATWQKPVVKEGDKEGKHD